MHYDLLLDFGAFSRPVLLQLSDDLAWRVLLPEGPQVLRRQRGAVPFHNKPAEGRWGGGGGGGEMSHTHEQQQNTQFTVNGCLMLRGVLQKIGGGCKETAYPVNHQKRIFDRNEASLTGHGFCKISNNRLTAGFIATHANWMTSDQPSYLLVREC